MDSNVYCNNTMTPRLGVGTLPWLRRAGKTAVTVTVAALAFVTTVGAPQAYAARSQYPGEMCFKWTGAGIPKYYYGGIGNASTTDWLYLDCPLVTDREYQGDYYMWAIAFRDLHYSADISCTHYNVANAGPDGAYYIETRGNPSSTGAKYEKQGKLFVSYENNPNEQADPVNYLSCAIPPAYNGSYRSYILYYWMYQE